ncbi:MAG: hypothetical protein ACYTGX_04295 [Planctomycetota bacterium]|jgi:hypothetical protein
MKWVIDCVNGIFSVASGYDERPSRFVVKFADYLNGLGDNLQEVADELSKGHKPEQPGARFLDQLTNAEALVRELEVPSSIAGLAKGLQSHLALYLATEEWKEDVLEAKCLEDHPRKKMFQCVEEMKTVISKLKGLAAGLKNLAKHID